MSKYHKWTAEQDNWLIANYPALGAKNTMIKFNRLFNLNVGIRAIEHRCNDKLRLRITEDRKLKITNEQKKRLKGRGVPVGYINENTKMIKTNDGWMRISRFLNVPKGQYAVHLDNDITNNTSENIRVISPKISMKMTINKFWSKNSVVTETGILCCELEDLLNDNK